MSISLFEHNRIAYSAAVSMLTETGKAAIVHPTGTGKSFIGFKLCEDKPKSMICWLSPSEYIFKTQLENLVATGAEVPANIAFYTYAKLMLMGEDEIADIQPDYIILDEFHRCGAIEWGKGVDCLLDMYDEVPILGLSATNIRYLDNQRDMADELFDGNIASEMTLGEAIVRNILLPPTYVISLYAYQKDMDKYERRVRTAKNKLVKNAAEKYLDALRRALEKADGIDVIFEKHMSDRTGKYIVFCANFEHMREMIDSAEKWFSKVDASPHIYSAYSDDPETDKAFADFKADDSEHLKLLYCINMLNEGVHVDDISGVILFRPTVSPIIYKQQIGRALSAGKNRNPIIFDIVNNFENLYSIGAIEEEMQAAISYYRYLGENEQVVNDTFKIIDEVRDCRRLFDELEETLSASWDLMYAEAKKFFEEHGNLLISNKYKTESNLYLGQWVDYQRRIRTGRMNGRLTEHQIEKLDDIGMVWCNRYDLLWERNYQFALRYYQTLPWNYRGWHAGGTANDSYIGFEICEDGLTDPTYFSDVYKEALELCVYLCRQYGLTEKDIVCHSEGYKLGIASNHADVMHWFPKHGKSMDTFRADVKADLFKQEDESLKHYMTMTQSKWAQQSRPPEVAKIRDIS